jgi:very-short-patch-repair endonuclease/predicted transcriptional regulator of viral defense system
MDLRTLDHLAAPHAGVVSRFELLAAGWSESQVARAVRSGALIRVCHGVYRVAGARWSRRAAYHAAVLTVGVDAHVARWSAAELHGFVEPRRGPVDVLLPHPRSYAGRSDRIIRVHRTRSLPEQDRDERDGLPVTAPARTLLDLASTTSVSRLGEHVAAAMRVRACGYEQLLEVLDRRRNARGRGRLREVLLLLGEDGAGARSDVEVAALHHLVDAGLPRPALAFRVHDDQGRFVAEVDLAYPQIRLAIEIDGFRWHSSPARKRADEERQNRLILAGWIVLRFSATEVRTHPDRLVVAVRAALASARTPVTPAPRSGT